MSSLQRGSVLATPAKSIKSQVLKIDGWSAEGGPLKRPSTVSQTQNGAGPSSSGVGLAQANGRPMHPPGTCAGRGRPSSSAGLFQDAPGPLKVAPFGSAVPAKPKGAAGSAAQGKEAAGADADAGLSCTGERLLFIDAH